MSRTDITVQEQDFDIAREYQGLRSAGHEDGAVVTFTGLVRDFNQNCDVKGMFLEHYPGMTEKMLEIIVHQARERWSLNNIRIIHRVGQLYPGDQIVYVGVTSAHREAAFAAAEFVMDFLKTQAPFWKKELTSQGSRWVEANEKDQQALKKWRD